MNFNSQLQKGILDWDGMILTLRRPINLKSWVSSVFRWQKSQTSYETSDHVNVLVPVILKDHTPQEKKKVFPLMVSKTLQISTTVTDLHISSGTQFLKIYQQRIWVILGKFFTSSEADFNLKTSFIVLCCLLPVSYEKCTTIPFYWLIQFLCLVKTSNYSFPLPLKNVTASLHVNHIWTLILNEIIL